MREFKKFTVKIRKGIDDLLSHSPYCNSHDWPTFCPFYEIAEEEYLSNSSDYESKAQAANDKYVEELKESGTYGNIYERHFHMKSYPDFDNPSVDDDKFNYSNFGLFIPKGLPDNKELP